MKKPTLPEVRPMVSAYRKAGNHVGGSLHIVLDDGNVDDDSVRWCAQYARDNGDKDGEVIAEVLLMMSKTQRSKLAGEFYSL